MRKKLLTLDDLVKFCKKEKLYRFNAEESGYQLCVQVPATFKAESDTDSSMLIAEVKVFHTGLNRNKSSVTIDAAKKSLSTIAYKPILANFCEIDGEMDFTSHDVEIDDDGNIQYLEKQVGCFTADKPYMVQDEKREDRQYVYAKAAIPREYTAAADIIERKNGTKVSVELAVNNMEYDAKSKELLLTDIEVMGCTLLGKNPESGENVEEGMEGARLDIADFSQENNSVVTPENLSEIIQKSITEAFNNISNFQRKEENNVQDFEENVEVELVEESVEEVIDPSSEDFENKPKGDDDDDIVATTTTTTEEPVVEEPVEEEPKEDSVDEPEDTVDDTEDDSDDDSDDGDDSDSVGFSVTVNGKERNFALSLNEKIYALYELVNDTYSESDNDYYDVAVYEDDKTVVMHGWFNNKHYRQKYSVKKDVYSLTGDRVEVYATYLTKDEQNQLDALKNNFEAAETELAKYKAEPEKMELLNSADYSAIAEAEEFIELKKECNHFDLTFDEIKAKADELLLNAAKAGNIEFAKSEKVKEVHSKQLPARDNKKSGRYGNLFKKN